MTARIKNISLLSPLIKRITLEPVGSGLFPTPSAGAHILVEIPGVNRIWKNAYSLVSAPDERARYEIIVRRVEHSRGGSAYLHDHAKVGDRITIGLPVNLFPVARMAQKHLLLSAGIGITPFLSYIPILQAKQLAFEMHHCCKVDEAAAFNGLLPKVGNVVLHTGRNTLNLNALLAAQKLDTHLYVCGPEEFMDLALATAQKLGWPGEKVHKESFGGATGGMPFRVRLARSGIAIEVPEDRSLLEALENAGVDAPCLCRGGACGECELTVLDGVPDHHDHFLSHAKRATGKSIMTCVSRAKTPELVLDI
jgi:dimethylamine monooxygenase subunit B